MGNPVRGTLKKLTEAAFIWAGGKSDEVQTVQVDENILSGLKAMGCPADLYAEFEAAQPAPPPDFEVHEDNWVSFQLFTGLKTQWQIVAGFDRPYYTGLYYPAVEAFFNLLSIPKKQRPVLLADIQIMEQSALDVFNKPKQG